MFSKKLIILNFFCIFYFFNLASLNAEIVKNIEISGNDRISSNTIKLFSNVLRE